VVSKLTRVLVEWKEYSHMNDLGVLVCKGAEEQDECWLR
jgi:hypothetical protein